MSWRHALVLAAVLLPGGAVAACSDPPNRPPAGQGSIGGGAVSGGGGGGSAEGGVDAGDADGALGDGGVCNDLVITGQTVDRIGVLGDPPAGKGGTIVDGTYVLTDYSVFVGAGGVGGPTGITAKGAIRFTGGRVDELLEFGGTGNPSVVSTSSSYGATAATFATTQLCPSSGVGATLQYTSNDPVIVLTDPATKEAFTFTKR
jgi:hypothetical protein